MTTKDALNKIAFDEGFNDWTHLIIYEEGCTANITTYVQKAMILYAEHVRDEDRKVVAENVQGYTKFYGWGKECQLDGSEYSSHVNKDSIINAPKLELK